MNTGKKTPAGMGRATAIPVNRNCRTKRGGGKEGKGARVRERYRETYVYNNGSLHLENCLFSLNIF